MYTEQLTATIDNQTEFIIPIDTYDINKDSLLVQSGLTMLFPNEDFIIESPNKVILTEGVPVNTTIGFYVFKNVIPLEEEDISGVNIAVGSLPIDRLNELVVTSDSSLTLNIDESGKVSASYTVDGEDVTAQFDVSDQIETHNTSQTAHAGVLAPMYSYGTTELEDGVSPLASGVMYLVYEES